MNKLRLKKPTFRLKPRPKKAAEAPELAQTEGYVAFMDILGFKALLENPNHAALIIGIIRALQAQIDFDGKRYPSLRYIAISDTIIIGAKLGEGWRLLQKICQVQNRLLKQGFAVRGALCRGPILTHEGRSNRNIFGSTYTRAYELQENLAIYPRVIIESEEVAEKLKNEFRKVFKLAKYPHYVCQDADGMFFVNQFGYNNIRAASDDADIARTAERNCQRFRKQILNGLKATAAEARFNMKWRWLEGQFRLHSDVF